MPSEDKISEIKKRSPSRGSWILVLIVLGSLIAIVNEVEYWPFSRYPMYARPIPRRRLLYNLRGVSADSEHNHEFALVPKRMLYPLDRESLEAVLETAANERGEMGIDQALKRLHLMYDEARRKHENELPAIAGLRLYREFWITDPVAEESVKTDPPASSGGEADDPGPTQSLPDQIARTRLESRTLVGSDFLPGGSSE